MSICDDIEIKFSHNGFFEVFSKSSGTVMSGAKIRRMYHYPITPIHHAGGTTWQYGPLYADVSVGATDCVQIRV